VEGDPLEDLDADERVIWKRLLKKWDGTAWTGLIWLMIKIKGEHFVHCNSISGPMKCGKFRD
jgi:hypothetical protein